MGLSIVILEGHGTAELCSAGRPRAAVSTWFIIVLNSSYGSYFYHRD
jgi:hypothetical protein